MKPCILLDTGPLVAIVNRQDRYHTWARNQWQRIVEPLLTCESVLSETCFLLRESPRGVASVMQMLAREVITLPFCVDDHIVRIESLLKKYHDVPMSLADACLVRMSEVYSESIVFTIDNDFKRYRRHGRGMIPTIMPDR